MEDIVTLICDGGEAANRIATYRKMEARKLTTGID